MRHSLFIMVEYAAFRLGLGYTSGWGNVTVRFASMEEAIAFSDLVVECIIEDDRYLVHLRWGYTREIGFYLYV